MDALDILILIVTVTALVMGYIKGLISQAAQICGVVGGVVLSRLFGGVVARAISGDGGAPEPSSEAAAYAIVFVVCYVAVWLASRALKRLIGAVSLGVVDHIGGALFRAVEWLLGLSLAINVYAGLTDDRSVIADADKPWREPVADLAPAALGYLHDMANNDTPDGVDTNQATTTNDER
ncbi:MAG: CvpA family protein [Muribaculaceae bacterium]